MVDPQFEAKDPIGNLVQLQEECAEVIEVCSALIASASRTQIAVSKMLRFGASSTNPKLPPEEQVTNAEKLGSELFDLELRIEAVRKIIKILTELKCPACGGEAFMGYGLAGGGVGSYTSCLEDCGYFAKIEDAIVEPQENNS